MLIKLERYIIKDKYTIGRVFVDGKFFSFSMEDEVRTLNSISDKVKGQTAIPYGRYEVIVSYSNRFDKNLPELLKVPYFDKIRIHGGNSEIDTEGCILVGAEISTDERTIRNCKEKVNELIAHIKEGQRKGKVWIEITREFKTV